MKQSLIIIFAFLVGSVTGSLITYKTTIGAVESQGELIARAIDNPTTAIDNNFETNIKKLKNKKGVIDSETNPDIENQIKEVEKKRRGLFRIGRK